MVANICAITWLRNFFLCTPENDLRAQTASLLRMETNQRMRSLVSKQKY